MRKRNAGSDVSALDATATGANCERLCQLRYHVSDAVYNAGDTSKLYATSTSATRL